MPLKAIRTCAAVFLLMSVAGCRTLQIDTPAQLSDHWESDAELPHARFDHATSNAVDPPLTEIWAYNAQAGFGQGRPLIVGDFVFVGTRQGNVVAIELVSGDGAGAEELGASIDGSMVYRAHMLYVPIAWGDYSLTAFQLLQGETRWRKKGPPVTAGLRLAGSHLLAADTDGILSAYRVPSGVLAWQRAHDQTSFSADPVIVDDRTVIVASQDGAVVARRISDGTTLWRTEMPAPVYESPTLGRESVFVPTTRGHLLALDVSSGDVRWRVSAPDSTVRFSTPAAADTRVYVGRSDGVVAAYDAETGSRIWQHRAEDAVVAAPLATRGHIYVGTMGRKLLALEADSGRRTWQKELEGRVKSAMATYGNRIVVLSEPRYVYLFESDAGGARAAIR